MLPDTFRFMFAFILFVNIEGCNMNVKLLILKLLWQERHFVVFKLSLSETWAFRRPVISRWKSYMTMVANLLCFKYHCLTFRLFPIQPTKSIYVCNPYAISCVMASDVLRHSHAKTVVNFEKLYNTCTYQPSSYN